MTKKRHPPYRVYCEPQKSPEGGDPGGARFYVIMATPEGKMRVGGDESDRDTFKSWRDISRNDERRRKFAPAIAYGTDSSPSSEDLLLREEKVQMARAALGKIFGSFDRDDPARTVLFHALRGVDFSDTRELAARSGLAEAAVTAAKRKIQRRVRAANVSMDQLLRRAAGSA